jgi:Deoxyribodipyrimidine photolyase
VKQWVPEFETNQYASPIVDHKEARERCLITYKKALNN